MRFYEILITDPNNPKFVVTYTSWANNKPNMAALNVLFDIYTTDLGNPKGLFMLEIWGIPLRDISNAADLNGKNIKISAGFKKGLPLATAASLNQSGPLVQGRIQQCFGNWIGTDMTLNMMISPGSYPANPNAAQRTTAQQSAASPATSIPIGSVASPINIAWNQPAGMELSTAVENALKAALPTYAIYVDIRPNIIVDYPVTATFPSVQQFGQAVQEFSARVIGGDYTGVKYAMSPSSNTIYVYDDTTRNKTVQIKPQDLIGQPTWLGPATIQFKCPMRADLQINYRATLPIGFFGVMPQNPQAVNNYRARLVQTGEFNITDIRHVGNFRQPDAASWVTVVTCVPATPRPPNGG